MGRGRGADDGHGGAGLRGATRTRNAQPDAELQAADGFRRPETEEDLWPLAPYVLTTGGERRYAVKPIETTRHYDDAIRDLLIGHGRGYSYEELADLLAAPPWGRDGTGLTKRDLGGKSDKKITADDIRQDVPNLILRLDAPFGLRREPNPRDEHGQLIYEPVIGANGQPELDADGEPKTRLVQGRWRLQLLDADSGADELRHIRSYESANRASATALRETADGAKPTKPDGDDDATRAVLSYLVEHAGDREPIRSDDLETALGLSDGAVRSAVATARKLHWPLVWDGTNGYRLLRAREAATAEGRRRIIASADSLDGRGETQETRQEDLAAALDSWYGSGAGRRNAWTDRSAAWAARHDQREQAKETRKAAIQAADKGHQQQAQQWARGQLVQYDDDRDLQRVNASLSVEQRDAGIAALNAAENEGREYGDETNHLRWQKVREYREYLLLAHQGWLPRSMRRAGSWHDEVLDDSCWKGVKSEGEKRLAKGERQAQRKRDQNAAVRRREEAALKRQHREADVDAKLDAEREQRRKSAELLGFGELDEAQLAADLAAR